MVICISVEADLIPTELSTRASAFASKHNSVYVSKPALCSAQNIQCSQYRPAAIDRAAASQAHFSQHVGQIFLSVYMLFKTFNEHRGPIGTV